MPKTIQVNLQFNANVKRAQAEIKALQDQLNSAINASNNSQLKLTPQIQQAQASAMQLKIALNNAFNVDTGKLNLNKLQTELNKTGKTTKQFAKDLQALGPKGTQAFAQFAQQVQQADTKIFSLSGGMKKLTSTFMNTARWYVTSSIINNIVSSFGQAVDYAKKLDKSLNNIRIVTGKSADEMARFAKNANTMAKELSTSTTKYTDASLIYYQQGLNDKAVKERTDVTVKLANVVGESAETVSEWMTAIWNNFDDGSESLEYYADVLAKLGAATASSADEIAGGLEKFAAVADTIGLSYEYAASMLATITAETRQSEDVVGTALKTILSRMEQLSLGESLDDGTTLGKYSLALEKIGVSIKDANGELKDMDVILQATGERWNTLTRDQQVALAQSVAGIRQYTQFMALMDNWDVMERNLKLTEESVGALGQQQAIYEESMAASQERMTAAAESLKATLLGADDLIPLYDFATDALEIVNKLLDAFGGLPTILWAVATALSKTYQPQIASFAAQAAMSVKNLGLSFKNFAAGKGFQAFTDYKLDVTSLAAQGVAASAEGGTLESSILKDQANLQATYIKNQGTMTERARQQAEWEMEILKAKQQQVIANEKLLEKQSDSVARAQDQLTDDYNISQNYTNRMVDRSTRLGVAEGHTELAATLTQDVMSTGGVLSQASRENIGTKIKEQLVQAKTAISEVDGAAEGIDFDAALRSVDQFVTNGSGKLKELLSQINNIQLALGQTSGMMVDTQGMKKTANAIDETDKILNNGGKITSKGFSKALNDIDTSKLSNKQDKKFFDSAKKRHKTYIEERKALKDKDSWMKKNNKTEKEYNDALKANTKTGKTLRKEIKSRISGLKDESKGMRMVVQDAEKLEKADEKVADATSAVSNSARENGKNMAKQKAAISGVVEESKNLDDRLKNGKISFTHWSEGFASMVGVATQAAMGLNMITSAAEGMGRAFAMDNASLSDWLPNIMSMGIGLMQVLPIITKVNKAIEAGRLTKIKDNVVTTVRQVLQKMTIRGNKDEGQSEDQLNQKKGKTIIKNIATAISGVIKQIGQGPGGWATAAISLAAMAGLAALIGTSIASGINTQKRENQEEQLTEDIATLETIDTNQELATSVSDLTEEYKALQAAGASTSETLKNMKDKIPELIESYKELGETMGGVFNTAQLERAYNYFLATGDISQFETKQKQLDEQIADQEYSTALTSADKAVSLIQTSEASRTFADVATPGEVLDKYDELIRRRNQLSKNRDTDSAEYQDLTADIKAVSEYIDNLRLAQNTIYEIEKSNLLESNWGYRQNITTLAEYENSRQSLIDKLKEEKHWTNEQAISYLKADSALGAYEDTINKFATTEDGIGGVIIRNMGTEGLEEIKKWYAELTQEERTLAEGIDFSVVDSIEKAKQALAKIKETAAEAEVLEEVTALEIDENVFETYTEGLMAINSELKENSAQTKQIALNNLKISKGLTTLTKSWDDNLAIIKRESKASLEYAKAMDEVQTALEEAFGFKPSTKFIEQYSDTITQVVAGNLNELENLQDALAKDYIANMSFSTSVDRGQGVYEGTIADAQKVLNDLINDLDTSIAVGEGSSLSEDYLNTIQQMLDAGVIAEDQLEGLFRAKGYELEVTGWDYLDGPIKTVTQTITHSNGDTEVNTITESEKIKVPIINGDKSRIKEYAAGQSAETVSSKPSISYTKSTSPKVIDTSAAEERNQKAQERLNKLDEEAERYHEIEVAMSDVERELKRLSAAKDQAYGQSKIALMNQEIKAQEKMIELAQKYQKEAEMYYEQDRKDLLSNYAVKLDDWGNIINYEELEQQYIDQLKANVYNDSTYEKIEKNYEAFKDTAKRYESSLQTMKDKAQEVKEEQQTLFSEQLGIIEYAVEYKIELKEDSLKFIEHQLSKIEDDAFAAAEAIGLLGQQTGVLLEKNKVYQQGISDILGASFSPDQVQALLSGDTSVLGDQQLTDQQISDLREYIDGLYEMNDALRETRTQMYEKLGEAFEAWNEKLDAGAAKIERYGSVLESYKNIIDTVGKDALGISDEVMEQLNEAQVNNSTNALKSAKAIRDANKETIDNLRAQYETMDKDSEGAKLLEEQIKAAEETLLESEENFMSSWNDALSAAADAFKSSVEMIAESFGEAVSGIYDSLDAMSEAFDRQKEMNERYLQDYKKAYEINKLNRDITNSIDTTDNLKAQQQLRDLMSEINAYQAEGKQMSQYDLEYMQKKYDLLVAEAAFREAQNAKNQVRLQRDSEGNWGYVYTANEADSAKAEQNYEDKIYAMEDFMYNTEVELTEFYINRLSEYQSQVAELAELYGEDSEVFQEKLQLLQQQLFEDTGYSLGQLELFATRAGKINEVFGTRMVATYKDSILGQMYTNYADWSGLMADVNEQVNLSIQAVMTKHTEFQGQVEKAMEAAGISADTFAGKVSTMATDVNKKSDAAADDVEDMAKRMVTAFGNENSGLIGEINTWETEYGNMVTAIQQNNLDIIDSINTALAKYAELARAAGIDYKPSGDLGGEGADNPLVGPGSFDDTLTTEYPESEGDTTNLGGQTLSGGYTVHSIKDKTKGDITTYALINNDTGALSFAHRENITFADQANTGVGAQVVSFTEEIPDNKYGFKINDLVRLSNTNINTKASQWKTGSDGKPTAGAYAPIYNAAFLAARDGGLRVINLLPEQLAIGGPGVQLSDGYWYQPQSLVKAEQPTSNLFPGDTIIGKGKEATGWSKIQKFDRGMHKDGKISWDDLFGADGEAQVGWTMRFDGVNYIRIFEGDDDQQYYVGAAGVKKFDTGGYTGDWGDSSGRLALLHRKEIILNASDTENFLQAIHIVRSISDKIEALAAFTAQGLGSLSVNAPASTGDTLEQNVTIHAEFPNATNHSEIEQAFDNLINRASQYVNRK